MQNIATLDKLKTRMEAARDVLREAEAWSTLDSEVTAYIAEQAFSKAADRLAEASRSMVVFKNTPEYEGRRALMISLQNGLEASLSASLVQAINARDVKTCKTYYNLFVQIQREAEFRNYYYGSRRASLVEEWQGVTLADCGEVAVTESTVEPISFKAFLKTFFNHFERLLEEETAYIPSIFPDPLSTLSTFLQTTLDGLLPSLHQRLSDLADFYTPSKKVLPELIAIYQSIGTFAVAADRILDKMIDPPPSVLLASPSPDVSPAKDSRSPSEHARRLSQRFSVSHHRMSNRLSLAPADTDYFTIAGNAGEPRLWEVALFEPLLDWQTEYAALEQSYLSGLYSHHPDAWLSSTGETSSANADKQARQLWDQLQSIFSLSEDAFRRCLDFTRGYGAKSYLIAIDRFGKEAIERQSALVAQIQKRNQLGIVSHSNKPVDSLCLDGLDYTAQDWASFELGLKLLATCRQLATRIKSFESTLAEQLGKTAATLAEPGNQVASTDFIDASKGAITLLKQSTLYSAELQKLFKDVTKPPIADITLFSAIKAASIEFTKTCQLLLHNTILGPLKAGLDQYARAPAWTSATNANDVKGAFSLNMPTFSASPTEYATRFGEGLFNLPRLFEVYAEDDALAFSLNTLPFTELPPALEDVTHRMHNKRQSSLLADRSQSSRIPQEATFSAEFAVHTWLNSLTTAAVTHYVDSVLPQIPNLSTPGTAQLKADLAHISNVAIAYDVELADLTRWQEVLDMSDAEGRRATQDESNKSDGVFERIARLRGWT